MNITRNRLQFFLLSVLLFLLPAIVQAQFTFTTNADNTITITRYTGTNTDVVIPDSTNGYPVTSIGQSAFQYFIAMTSVTIPSSVTHIGIDAFNSCLNLTNVTIPASVTNIEDYAFFYCTNLRAIVVDGANPNYSSADGVLFNKAQTVLLQFPFGKTGSYAIPDTVTNLSDEAFGINDFGYPFSSFFLVSCVGLTNLSIPSSLAMIPDHAFAHCAGLRSVTLSPGTKSIGEYAFFLCSGMTSINLPDSVTNIGPEAFYYSGLTSVTIPGSIANVSSNAFAVCSSLFSVTIQDGVSSIGNGGFNFCTSLTTISIPDSITSIGNSAFWFCTGLTNVILPSNVTNVGQYAFSSCASLMNIDVDAGNLFYSSVDGVLLDKDKKNLIQFPGGRGGSYTIPNGVTNIYDYAFGVYDSSSGFYYSTHYLLPCRNLTNITVASSVNVIGYQDFGELIDLQAIHFAGDVPMDSADLPYYFNIKFYYLPGTIGWSGIYSATPWLPAIQARNTYFDVQTNQFGFNVNWASGQTVVVEACTNLFNPDWQPVQTNVLTTGSAYFSDPQWTNYPGRFYRLRSL